MPGFSSVERDRQSFNEDQSVEYSAENTYDQNLRTE